MMRWSPETGTWVSDQVKAGEKYCFAQAYVAGTPVCSWCAGPVRAGVVVTRPSLSPLYFCSDSFCMAHANNWKTLGWQQQGYHVSQYPPAPSVPASPAGDDPTLPAIAAPAPKCKVCSDKYTGSFFRCPSCGRPREKA
jgi:hypothetical protein